MALLHCVIMPGFLNLFISSGSIFLTEYLVRQNPFIMKSILTTAALIASCLNILSATAQTTASGDITWLGLDFSQASFIGSAKDAGNITSDQFRDKYTTSWNQLIVNQPKVYDVAGMVHRPDIKYALNVTAKANRAIQRNFFSANNSDFRKMNEKVIGDIVSHYNFQAQQGTGVIIFVDGMSTAQGEAGGWVTMVDMKTKRVLSTTFRTGKAGGFGFKNYWAKAWANILAYSLK